MHHLRFLSFYVNELTTCIYAWNQAPSYHVHYANDPKDLLFLFKFKPVRVTDIMNKHVTQSNKHKCHICDRASYRQ